jgi:hypothetical protein
MALTGHAKGDAVEKHTRGEHIPWHMHIVFHGADHSQIEEYRHKKGQMAGTPSSHTRGNVS